MKIGIYDPYLDDLGGGEKYMMTIAECLSAKHEVSVFWDQAKDFAALKERFSLNLDKVKLTKNIFAKETSIWERIWETKKYDAIIFLSDGSFPLSFSKKLFVHIQQPLAYIGLSSWKGKLKAARLNAVIYNSKFTQAFNQKALPGVPARVIYPPVKFLNQDVAKENIILHVGRYRTQAGSTSDFKKQDVMIAAFKHMVEQKMLKNWRFVLAVSVKKEDEEKFDLLRQEAKGYPISFLVNKSNDELWATYNKAKIYWHASGFGEDLEKHPEYAEHFGISTVEAMGAGCVPVVINSGGQKEIVTDKENGFLWNSLNELYEQTEKLAKDDHLWNQMAKKATIRAKEFGNEKFCEEITQLVTGE